MDFTVVDFSGIEWDFRGILVGFNGNEWDT